MINPVISPEKLAEIILFKGLAAGEIEQVIQAAHTRTLAEGESFFFQGDPADKIYVLISGRVKIAQVTTDGQQVLLRMASAWTLMGAVALSPTDIYPATAQASEVSTALYWHKKDMMLLVRQMPQLALNAIQFMAQHLQEFQDRYRELATQRVERRLARTILRLASQTGRKVEEGVLIDMPLTRQDLAEMSGTTLYTVSRTLSQWEADGLIISGREKVIIRFPHGLVAIAEDLQP